MGLDGKRKLSSPGRLHRRGGVGVSCRDSRTLPRPEHVQCVEVRKPSFPEESSSTRPSQGLRRLGEKDVIQVPKDSNIGTKSPTGRTSKVLKPGRRRPAWDPTVRPSQLGLWHPRRFLGRQQAPDTEFSVGCSQDTPKQLSLSRRATSVHGSVGGDTLTPTPTQPRTES